MVRPALPRRVLALLLTGLYVFALAGSFVHRIVVEHVPCADHGELVHTDGGPAGPDGAAGDAGPDGDTGDHEHDHCLLAAFAHGDARTSERLVVEHPAWPPAVARAPASPALPERAWGDAARYRLAPKGSPPAPC